MSQKNLNLRGEGFINKPHSSHDCELDHQGIISNRFQNKKCDSFVRAYLLVKV